MRILSVRETLWATDLDKSEHRLAALCDELHFAPVREVLGL